MPTIYFIGPVKIKIYPHDHDPPHVHAIGPGCEAKFELETLLCTFARGFTGKDLRRIQNFLTDHKTELLEEWNEYQEK